MKNFTLILLTLFFVTAGAVAADTAPDISRLNANRSQYDGKKLTLRGFLVIGPESMYLVRHLGYNKDYWVRDSGCLSLLDTGDLGKKESFYNEKYIALNGTFRADNRSYGISFSECGLTGIDIGGNVSEHIKILDRNK